MQEENPAYRQEISRLNYIIDLLIKENEQLKQLLQLTAQQNASNNLISSNPLQGNDQNESISSNPLQRIEQNELISSNPLQGIEQNELISSNPLQGIEQNKLIISNPLQGNDQKHLVSFNPLQEIGQKRVIWPTSLQGIAPKQHIGGNAPQGNVTNNDNVPVSPEPGAAVHYNLIDVQQRVITNNINANAVLKQMKAERITAPNDSVATSLKLLLHFALTPENTHAVLCKLTGMSASGLSKHISLLKKKGYIKRLKFQHYALTQKTLQLMGGS